MEVPRKHSHNFTTSTLVAVSSPSPFNVAFMHSPTLSSPPPTPSVPSPVYTTSFAPSPLPTIIPVISCTQDPPQRCALAEARRMRTTMGAAERPHQRTRRPATLPSALEKLSTLADQLIRERRRLVFFLDYDGTLSPIVEDPDSATMPERTREALSIVASRFTTAIVTGRSRKKVMSMVKLEQLIYAGSHGFDIEGPKGTISHLVASDWLPSLKRAYDDLELLVPHFPGSVVEDNLLSVSFHYRKCDQSIIREVQTYVDEIATRHGLVRKVGKMVHEVRPLFDWHKGKAVEYLLDALQLVGPEVLPIYIGDDVTDEDAFKVLQGKGISVIVTDPNSSRDTHADMRLNDPKEVQDFLMHFAENDSFAPQDEPITISSD